MSHFIPSCSAKLPPPLWYLDYKKPFKTLNGEGRVSWSWLLSLLGFTCSIMHVASCAAVAYRSGVAWGWVDVKCGHRLWARSTSWVSIEMTGRQAGRPSARSASLIQDGSHSRTSWHLMVQVWGGHYWWQRGETSVCSNYVKYLKSFSAWSNFVRHHLPTMKHLSVT